MNRISRKVMWTWASLGPRFLPFADAATPDLPLSRLLRLSLFQVSVGMALTLLVGTLNRVMIVELDVPASLVGVMISLPLLFAPFRALIGFKSDTHQSALGWRRVPFIFRGTMVQFGGLAIMPFALLVLSGGGNAAHYPTLSAISAPAIAFLLVGAGLHTVQTVGLALATDQTPTESQPKVVGLMYVMLLVGMIASAFLFGAALADFTPAAAGAGHSRLRDRDDRAERRRAVEAGGPRESRPRDRAASARVSAQSWESFIAGGNAMRRLTAVGLGTLAFSMEDVLLEPYGGQILHLTVGSTTKLTATLAVGGLFGFALASRVLSRGADPFRMACWGALVGCRLSSLHRGRAAAIRPGRSAWAPSDRIRRRPVRPRHVDRDDEPGAGKSDRSGARRLGRRAGLGGGLRNRARRRHSRRRRRRGIRARCGAPRPAMSASTVSRSRCWSARSSRCSRCCAPHRARGGVWTARSSRSQAIDPCQRGQKPRHAAGRVGREQRVRDPTRIAPEDRPQQSRQHGERQ